MNFSSSRRVVMRLERRRKPIFSMAIGMKKHLGGGAFRVRWVDEGGKININRADEETLRRVFTNLGVEEPTKADPGRFDYGLARP